MDELIPEEREAFLSIYDADHGDAPIAEGVIESLIRRGLVSRADDGGVAQTHAGKELYMQLLDDEPYEGI